MKQTILTKYAAAIIKDGKYLIVRVYNENFWKNVGGKVEDKETAKECLKREVKEELGVEIVGHPEHYLSTPITDVEGDPKRKIVIHVYKVHTKGDLKPSSEIKEMHWLSKKDYDCSKFNLAHQITEYIIPKLIKDGLLR